MSFGEKLRAARESRGYTQQQVADYMKIDKSTYCGYETGKRQPDVQKIKQLSKFLGVSGDDLLETDFASSGRRRIAKEDIMFALSRGREDIITDEMFDEIQNFADYVIQREATKKRK